MSHFPSARARSQGQRPGLTQDLFCAPKKPGKAANVYRRLLRGLAVQGRGNEGTRWDTSSRAGGRDRLRLLLPRQPDVLSTDPGAKLSLPTRPGSLSNLSSPAGDPVRPPPRGDPVCPPPPPPIPSEAQHLLCVTACLYFRRLWNCRVPAFTVLSRDAPRPSPRPCAPPADDSIVRLCRWRSGSWVGRSLTRAGLGVKK